VRHAAALALAGLLPLKWRSVSGRPGRVARDVVRGLKMAVSVRPASAVGRPSCERTSADGQATHGIAQRWRPRTGADVLAGGVPFALILRYLRTGSAGRGSKGVQAGRGPGRPPTQTGPTPGPATTVRNAEGLVQIQVALRHLAELARCRHADQRIHVRAVHIHAHRRSCARAGTASFTLCSNTP